MDVTRWLRSASGSKLKAMGRPQGSTSSKVFSIPNRSRMRRFSSADDLSAILMLICDPS